MKQRKFDDLLKQKVVLLDGATGTELARLGMPGGVCPEKWVLDNPEALIDIQRSYFDAGSDAVYSCTFGGNRFKLEEFGLKESLRSMNTELAQISREAAGDNGLVLGDLAPTGRFVEPFGDLAFEDAVACYREQAEALVEGGVDGFVIETMMDLQEARAALIAVKETCDLPALVTMTFGIEGRTLNGTDPLSALVTLQSLGASAVGCNCSTGPENMLEIIKQLKPFATVPLIAKPNAGMPKLRDGETVFDMTAAQFGSHGPHLADAGVNILGGCCGTAPEYIRALKAQVGPISPKPPEKEALAAVCSYRSSVLMGSDQGLTVIGERINPSGKKKLAKELQGGQMTTLKQYAGEQDRQGADVIDINVHVSGGDEPQLMRQAATTAALASAAPICVDTMNVEAMAQALRVYPGRVLLNSVSHRTGAQERIWGLAQKYGAMVVCMPLDNQGVPENGAAAIEIVKEILATAESFGVHKDHCLVDCLIMPAAKLEVPLTPFFRGGTSISPLEKGGRGDFHTTATLSIKGAGALQRTQALLKWCQHEGNVATLAGISNVSFGQKERHWLDGTLLSMAASLGLTAAMADTRDTHTLNLVHACDALVGRDPKFSRYLKRFGKSAAKKTKGEAGKAAKRTRAEAVFDAVMQGDEEGIGAAIEAALEEVPPRALVDDQLIAAINQVGENFDKKIYFLPQLIASADAMRKGFEVLQPYLAAADSGPQTAGPKVLLATVQGDIHDIGKNIVALMLKNYSFEVIDLGKDVSAETIIRAIRQHDAKIVGLSALMTTTMVEMKRVIELALEEGLEDVSFMIGGAVVDQHYADEIGAAGYAADALAAVRLAKGFSEKR